MPISFSPDDAKDRPWEDGEPTEEDRLQAQLEAAEAVAGQIQALETRIEILTGALEAIKKACMTWPGKGPAMRHIETLANLGLNDPRHEHIRRGK